MKQGNRLGAMPMNQYKVFGAMLLKQYNGFLALVMSNIIDMELYF